MANVPKNDKLGDRMKSQYEDRSRFFLPRRTYTVIRVDGRAFHTWTRGLEKPYDARFMECMDAAAIALCKEIAGARFAYVQSDEISVLTTDFADEGSQSWFDGNLQKTVSVSASIATVAFNMKAAYFTQTAAWVDPKKVDPWFHKEPNAVFDARAFTIPDYIEVENYFIWRQQDASRNSVTLLASAYASHKKLHGKSTTERHEIIHEAGDNWAKHPVRFKHGAVILKHVPVLDKTAPGESLALSIARRGAWEMDTETPSFTRNRDYLRNMIPRHWENDETTKKLAASA